MLTSSIMGEAMADGSFAFTPAVEDATAALWQKVKGQVTPLEWRLHAPLIAEINRLKREKNAVILAHNYMTPEIFHGVGDFVGDSLGLAREAARSDASDHRPGRRALHGGDLQGPLARKDGADPRPARRLLPRRLDHRRRRAPDQGSAIPACPWSPM